MKGNFKIFIEGFIVMVVITIIWKAYEYIFLEEIKPDIFDTIVALFLTFTIINIRRQAKIISEKDEIISLFKEYKQETVIVVEHQQKIIELLKEKNSCKNL